MTSENQEYIEAHFWQTAWEVGYITDDQLKSTTHKTWTLAAIKQQCIDWGLRIHDDDS